MAAKSSIIPILRHISLKYVSRQIMPARLFTACAGQLNSFDGVKWVSSARLITRQTDASNIQSWSGSMGRRSYSRSRKVGSGKVVSEDEEEEEEEEDYDDKEFGDGDLDVDEISEDELTVSDISESDSDTK